MTPNDHALQLLSEGKPLDAIPLLRELAWRAPSYKAYINLAAALRHAGQFDDAIQYLARAVKLDAALPHAWMALANISTDVGDWEHAVKYYEGAFFRVNQSPHAAADLRQVAMGLAQSLLRAHQFHEAWPLWEFGRYGYSYSNLPGTARWLGEPTNSLLVVCEGGYGDAMLFGRWLPFTKRRAKHVRLIVWDAMVKFRDWAALGVDEVIPKSAEIDATGIDYTTSWMSLPGIAGMQSVADIPKDPWFNLLKRERNRIGYCWRSEEVGAIRRVKSLSVADAEALASRLAAHGEVISLAPHGQSLHRVETEAWPSNVTQDNAALDGWLTTAATIRSCKFVVTVDTAVAHLAGLCGVPTMILLPRASGWMWGTMQNQPHDPWYGPHVVYFRNPDPLKWDVELIAVGASMLGEACPTR